MILELNPRPTSLHPPSHNHVTKACGKIDGVRSKNQVLRKNVQLGISRGKSGLAMPFGVAQQRKKKEWPYYCRAGSSDDESAHLCLFPLQSACLPTATGQLLVHEPHYVQMFEVIMEVARTETNIARFGMFHNLRSLDESHPTAFNDTTTSDNIAIGSCCHVEGIEDVGEARIVNYKCVGRFMIKSVKIHHPFHVADVDWVTDYPPDMPGAGSSGATRDRLEREVWQSLNDVANLTAKLNSPAPVGVGSPIPLPQDWLPAQVRQFAPVSLWTLSKPAPNRHVAAGGYPSLKIEDKNSYQDGKPPNVAGRSLPGKPTGVSKLDHLDIATWRQSSARGKNSIAEVELYGEAETNIANPYWSAREKLVKPLRQEAFSFAASIIVDAGVRERNALLETRDTSARLLWILDAVQPYLRQLRAQNSVQEAMESMF